IELHSVVADTVTTERSAEEVRYEILKTRDATLLTLAVFLAVAIAAASSSPVFAQYAPCPPGYSYVGASCYPSYNNPYGNPYNNPYNKYSNCQNGNYQNGYYYAGTNCYNPSSNNYYSNNYYSNNYYPGNYYYRGYSGNYRGYYYGNYYGGYYRNNCNYGSYYGSNCHR